MYPLCVDIHDAPCIQSADIQNPLALGSIPGTSSVGGKVGEGMIVLADNGDTVALNVDVEGVVDVNISTSTP